MPIATPKLTYPLDPHQTGGYLHHWLTLGPLDQQITATPNADESLAAFQARTRREHAESQADFVNVVELERVQRDDVEHFWEATHCQEDHWLSWHSFLPSLTHRQSWGYLHLTSAQPQSVTLHCTAIGPMCLWLNEQPILQMPEQNPAQIIEHHSMRQTAVVTATLAAGANRLLLRMEQVGVGDLLLAGAVRVEQAQGSAPIQVQLPTVTTSPRRRQRLQELFDQTHLDRAVYIAGDAVCLLAPKRASKTSTLLRLQRRSGAIYAETVAPLDSGGVIESVRGSQLPNGALDAVVMTPFQLFYNEKLRARHIHPLWVANLPYHLHPPTLEAQAESADARLIEALRQSSQTPGSIYAELAKMAFGWWQQVDFETIHKTIERTRSGALDMLPDLLGLLTMRARMPAYSGFPQELLPAIDQALAEFVRHAMPPLGMDETREANQLMLLSARLLAKQLTPKADAPAINELAGELVAWLAQRGRTGFAQWHSDTELLVLALVPLATLAQEESLREMAAAMLDMLFFNLAVHSFQGVLGVSRARVTTAALRSGRLTSESAISHLLWGVGGYQTGLAATTALALAASSYQLPDLIRTIALAQPEALWVRERHTDAQGEANLVSYKTPEYLLSSLQDYQPRRPGAREHVWQATLGPEALVFSNHPQQQRESDSEQPGWWVGNGTLPRVAQHRDSLIALYALPVDAWLRFTHLYFPTYAFDEHEVVDGWAFARCGDGYVAIWSAPGFHLSEQGSDAGRELRVEGERAIWLCQMGRRSQDGDFADFQRKVIATSPESHAQGVLWTTLRGETLAFGNEGDFLVDNKPVALNNFPRHESTFGQATYPADHLDVLYGEDGLRLHFS